MISVRPARPEEVRELADIGLASWKKGIMPLVPVEVASRIEKENPFFPFLKDQGGNILVAEADGALAGIGASEHADNYISDIWVAPEHEGKVSVLRLFRRWRRNSVTGVLEKRPFE